MLPKMGTTASVDFKNKSSGNTKTKIKANNKKKQIKHHLGKEET